MAKIGKYDKNLIELAARLEKTITELYRDASVEAGKVGTAAQFLGVGKGAKDIYRELTRNSIISSAINTIVTKIRTGINVAILSSIRSAWTLANDRDNEICDIVFGNINRVLNERQRQRYYNNHEDALDAFINRKEGGMTLSDRVWRYSDQFREEILGTLALGIGDGQSADRMARDLQQYLRYPDKLFRRVRDKVTGKLHLSRAAKTFHPGQGVARSSYKNALRLAGTETNIAYRTADHERTKDMDFVVGIEIHLSNNHTLNGKPFYDICDELQGRYPKDFKFVGWHPNCRCFVTFITKTQDELIRDLDGVDRGSVNAVKDLPPQFKEWLEENEDRIARSEERGTLPYFLRDNEWAWKDNTQSATRGTASIGFSRNSNKEIYELLKDMGATPITYSPEQIDNMNAVEKLLGIKRGSDMSFWEADGKRSNINYGGKYGGYENNCTACVLANEMRRRGFDVTALPNLGDEFWLDIEEYPFGVWANAKGNTPQPTRIKTAGIEIEDIVKKIEEQTGNEYGRYALAWDWPLDPGETEEQRSGHVIVVERVRGRLIVFDPQRGTSDTIENIAMRMDSSRGFELLRIDRLLFNPSKAVKLVESL